MFNRLKLLGIMKREVIGKVYIITYIHPSDGQKIFGCYASFVDANSALNEFIYQKIVNEGRTTEEVYEVYNPEVKEHNVYKTCE